MENKPVSDEARPAAFGRHRVLRALGKGGMGAVYLAEDTLLKRQVAVKVPLVTKADDPKVIERFLWEAQAAARVEHPNVCPVWEVGEQGEGYYLVMPFLEGTPLNRLIAPEQPWQPAEAVALLGKLADGVRAIHDKGIIHRDLKPGNVLLRGGEPVILDLGLARSLASESQQRSAPGTVLGTPAYMAPEQLMGDPKKLGPPTDVYALGVILYQLLTGRLPFEGPPHAVYAQILQAPPPAPSAARPGLDPGLDALCRRAMAKESGERPASAAAFAEQLRSCQGGTEVFPVDLPEEVVEPEGERLAETQTWVTGGGREPGKGQKGKETSCPRRVRPVPAMMATLGGLAVVGLVVAGLVASWGWLRETGTRKPSPGEARRPKPITNSVGMQFVRIPAGTFTMGSPETEKERDGYETQHEVEISRPFYLGVYEVTQAQFEKVMGYNPSPYCTRAKGLEGATYPAYHPGEWARSVEGLDTSSFPVENISWDEAITFCARLSGREEEKRVGRKYRLPTEAEWEYACRAGTITPFHFGNGLTSRLANFNGDRPYPAKEPFDLIDKGPFLKRPTKVGSYLPNPLGLYDMHGNVHEWCADWFGDYPTEKVKDPTGVKDPTVPVASFCRVFRGGCWDSFGQQCRSAFRGGNSPDYRSAIGFRVVLVPPGR